MVLMIIWDSYIIQNTKEIKRRVKKIVITVTKSQSFWLPIISLRPGTVNDSAGGTWSTVMPAQTNIRPGCTAAYMRTTIRKGLSMQYIQFKQHIKITTALLINLLCVMSNFLLNSHEGTIMLLTLVSSWKSPLPGKLIIISTAKSVCRWWWKPTRRQPYMSTSTSSPKCHTFFSHTHILIMSLL